MSRIEKLENKVKELYENVAPERDDWVHWLWKNHVLAVADYASALAKKYKADEDVSRAGALLHDIADVKMPRKNPNHEKESLALAEKLLKETGYSEKEIDQIVNDALKFHSCHGTQRPQTLEGKILATADSMAHLLTDFYVYAVWALSKDGKQLEEVKVWVSEKIERDLNVKIHFEDERTEARPSYEHIKALFSR